MTDTLPDTFENPHIQLRIEKKGNCKVLFSIAPKEIAIEAAREKAQKTVAKEINIPGFRKGKAPKALVEERFGKQIENEFQEILVRNSLNEAIQLSKIAPHSRKTPIKLAKFEKLENGSYLIGIEFESFPEIPSIDPTQLSIEFIAPQGVETADIEKRVEELRLRHAAFEIVEDRGAEIGDFVTLDIDAIDEPKTILHQDSRFHLSEGKIPKWAMEIILGMKVGENREGFSQPEKEENRDHFKPRLCKFSLKKIEKAVLPPLDDALCKKAGVDDVATLEKRIREVLTKEKEGEAKRLMRQAVKNTLLQRYPFEIPQETLDQLQRECHQIADQEKDHFDTDSAREGYEHTLFEEGKKNIRFSFLLPKIAKEHHISFPSVEEIRKRSTENLIIRYMSGEKQIDENEAEHFSRTAESELLTERILDFLIERGKRA